MRSSWATATAVLLLMSAAAGGRAQQQPSAARPDARLVQRLDARTAQVVSGLVTRAQERGLPAEPLVQKALEGASKDASGEAIAGAVASLLTDLGQARDALGPAPTAVLVLGAAVLDAGVSTAQLAQLRPQHDAKALGGALAGLAYLLSRGVPADGSLAIVQAMLDARLSDVEFASLQRLVEQDVRAGTPATAAAQVRAGALIRHGARLGSGGAGAR